MSQALSPSSARARSRGFTLIEMMMASLIVSGACVGLLAGFLNANRAVRRSADLVVMHRLADAKMQLALGSKLNLVATNCKNLPGFIGSQVIAMPAGTTPWSMDPPQASPGVENMSMGNYWAANSDGMIRALTPTEMATYTGLNCGEAQALSGPQTVYDTTLKQYLPVYCREVLYWCGMGSESSASGTYSQWQAANGGVAAQATVYTVASRVWKLADSNMDPVVHVETVAQ